MSGIKFRYGAGVYVGTLAEFTASTRKFPLGALLIPSDSDEVRVGNKVDVFDDLNSIPTADFNKAALVLALGAPTAFTAIAGVFADLAAARTAVNTLKTEADARFVINETKINAILSSLKTANLMLSA